MSNRKYLHDTTNTTHNCAPTAICAVLGVDEQQVEAAVLKHREVFPLGYRQRPRRGTGQRYSCMTYQETTPVLTLLGATILACDDKYDEGGTDTFPRWLIKHGTEAGVYLIVVTGHMFAYSPDEARVVDIALADERAPLPFADAIKQYWHRPVRQWWRLAPKATS